MNWRARLLLLPTLLLVCLHAQAMQRAFGWCQLGGQQVSIVGLLSTSFVQQSFKSCTVTIYLTNTLTLATIYSDNSSTPLGNPFTATSTGYWDFYAANGRYDVSLTGGGIVGTITYPDLLLTDVGAGGAITSLNGLSATTQTFATGTSGSDFGIVSAGSTHTFNLPTASASNRGLLSSADWSAFNSKGGALSFTSPLNLSGSTVSINFPFSIAQGGTGATTQQTAFDALSVLTTKGDFISFNGTHNVRVPIGTDTWIPFADHTQGVGWAWGACPFCAKTTPLGVADGGTGLSAGTSGGAPCYTGATTIASSSVFVSGGILVGGGAGACPGTSSLATTYNGQTLVGNGLSTVTGFFSATAQGASISTANLIASAPAGLYRVSAYLATSTAGSGNVVTTIGWTDAVGAKTLAAPGTLTLTSTAFVQQTIFIQVAATTNITYATAWTTTGQYNIYLTAERVQ